MNLLFSAAQMAARALYDNQTLEIWEANTAGGSFDPTIATSVSATIIWQCSNGYITTTTGTSHALTYIAPDSNPRRWTVRCTAGLRAITAIDCNTDSIASLKNLKKCTALAQIVGSANLTAMLMDLSEYNLSALTYLNLRDCYNLTGSLASLTSSLVNLYLYNDTLISGSLSSLVSTLQTCHLFSCTAITPASIAHLTAIRDIRLYSMWPALSAAASVDIVVDSMWAARAAYTYASGASAQLGGTNPDPTGNIVAPIEGTDWHEDTPGHWTPLTPGAKIYDLLNDVNSEGFNTWKAITIT